MKLLDRWGRDGRRAAGSRAAWILRATVLAGVTGVAWLAGVAAAHADPIAGPAQDNESASGLVPVSTSIVDTVAAAPEQAALAPVNQLESTTASILAVPGAMLNTTSENDATQANHTAVGSADATASDTDNTAPSTQATDELSAPAGAGNANVTAPRPFSSVLNATRPVTDSLVGVAGTITTPLTTAGPANGRPDSAASPLAALSVLTQPAAATAGQVGAMLLPTAPTSVVSGMPMSAPVTATGEDPVKRGGIVRDATDHDQNWAASAEQRDSVEIGYRSERPNWTADADGRPGSGEPVRTARYPDPGITATGGAPYPGSSGGCSPYDSAAGRCASDHADRNAQVSRVTPLTAVFGQLPDHVEDPAVSPD